MSQPQPEDLQAFIEHVTKELDEVFGEFGWQGIGAFDVPAEHDEAYRTEIVATFGDRATFKAAFEAPAAEGRRTILVGHHLKVGEAQSCPDAFRRGQIRRSSFKKKE